MAPERELTLEDAFGKFINSRKAMNAAAIRAYASCSAKFTKFCGEGKAASEAAKEDVIEFILWIEKNNPKIAKTSVSTYTDLHHVRAVLYFAMESCVTPRFKASLVRVEKKIKETYGGCELEKLLKKPGMAGVVNLHILQDSIFRRWTTYGKPQGRQGYTGALSS
jgi:hypothetical protein